MSALAVSAELLASKPATLRAGETHRPTAALVGHAPSFRLLDDFQAGYFKFNGREPRTLEEVAIARVDYEHQRRRAEIKGMARKLTQLDEFLPALAERGVKLGGRDITSWNGGKTLRFTSFSSDHDNRLFDALIALGFKEVERKDWGARDDTQMVTLKHGRALMISLDVKKAPAVLPDVPSPHGAA